MKQLHTLACLLALAFGALHAPAAVRFAALFSEHAVLQQDATTPVWGWAEPGDEVKVSIAGKNATGRAGADGRWQVAFAKLPVGGPYTLTAAVGTNSVSVGDVLVGEVWLGSGQSNMAMPVNGAKDADKEKAAADFPQLRMFKEESAAAATPQADAKGRWLVCTPQDVGGFSATLYFFGRELHRELAVPVGLINSSVGGTPIQSWTAAEAQRANPKLAPLLASIGKATTTTVSEAAKKRYERDLAKWQEEAKAARAAKQPVPRKPRDPAEEQRNGNLGGLFNGKIAPLIPYGLRGVIWYQGEANSVPDRAKYYGDQLATLITDWRARWGSELPFAWAQLPNFGGPGRDWPPVREGMLKTLALPKTGMGITIDIGEEKNIHPVNKQEVGRRLSLWALGDVYGRKVAATSGPLPAGHEIRGGEVVLNFTHADGGLVAKDGALKGFEIAGEDKQWKPAQARIEGDKVLVSSPDVPKPVAVRYAWANLPDCNLYNGAGLPASPFRTEAW